MKNVLTKQEYDALSDEFKMEYTQDGEDSFLLNVEGEDKSKKQLAEFRDNNIKLQKENQTLKAQLESMVSQDDHNELQEKLKLFEGKEMMDQGKHQELLAKSVREIEEKHQREVKSLVQSRDDERETRITMENKYHGMVIERDLGEAVGKYGAFKNEQSRSDFMTLASGTWKFDPENNGYVPNKTDGTILYSDNDMTVPMPMDEWSRKQFELRPYLFAGNEGSGSGGSGQSNSGGAVRVSRTDQRFIEQNAEALASGNLKIVD